jgi:hypothetical protein
MRDEMRISPIDPAQSDVAQYIVRTKRAMCEQEGSKHPSPKAFEPLPFADYFGLFMDGALKGFGELIFYAKAFRSYADCPWGGGYDLEAICGYERMVQLHAIYVDPRYRKGTPGFAYLCCALAQYARVKEVHFATATVCAADGYLTQMYERIGAMKIGSLSHLAKVKETGIDVTLYCFDIGRTVAGQLIRRFERHSLPRVEASLEPR